MARTVPWRFAFSGWSYALGKYVAISLSSTRSIFAARAAGVSNQEEGEAQPPRAPGSDLVQPMWIFRAAAYRSVHRTKETIRFRKSNNHQHMPAFSKGREINPLETLGSHGSCEENQGSLRS